MRSAFLAKWKLQKANPARPAHVRLFSKTSSLFYSESWQIR